MFIVAAVTDWFDGFLARRWNQTSAFGAFLDPVADKLMVAGALLVLVQLDRANAVLSPSSSSAAKSPSRRCANGWRRSARRKSVAVSSLGKIKTTAQMMAIPLLLFHDVLWGAIDTQFWGSRLLEVAAVLTVWSMFYYLRLAWPLIKEKAGSLD